jgi:hypothetical protein
MSEYRNQIPKKARSILLSRLSYWLAIFVISTVNIALLYYILVNAVFRDTVLPNIVFNGHEVGLANRSKVEGVLGSKDVPDGEFLTVMIGDSTFQVPLVDLKIKFNPDEALEFGRGANPIKVIKDASKSITGVEISQDFEFNPLAILNYSPVDYQSSFASSYDGEKVICRKDKYKFDIDIDYLEAVSREAILDGDAAILTYDRLFKDSHAQKLMVDCSRYFSEIRALEVQTTDFLKSSSASLELLYDLKVNENGDTRWVVSNIHELRDKLELYSKKSAIKPDVKDWKFKDNDIYLLSPYQKGRMLNVDRSYRNFLLWQGESVSPIVFDEVEKPEFVGRIVYDFSKVVGEGKTRLALKVDGVRNISISNAEGGLMLIDGVKVLPKEHFSYIDEVKKSQKSFSKEYSIGYGTCNSTTTIFRSALEGGFPIVERHSHGFVVESYAWGYPYNFVDASYFPDPRVDFKFTNDLPYPIYLKVIITRDDVYQYHTVQIRSAQATDERTVEVGDWKYIDNYNSKSFTGQFSRTVKDKDGNITRTDKFVSRYR